MFNPAYAMRIGLQGARQTNAEINTIAQNLDNVGRVVRRVAGIAAAVGGVAVGIQTIRSASREWVSYADEAQRAARLTGLTTESFTGLAHAAKRSDMDVATLTRGLWRLNQSMVRAHREGGQHQQIFDALGVSITDAAGNIRVADEVLLELADRFAAIEDPALKAEAATRIFGERAGARIPELMQRGRAGIEAFIREAERMNLVISDESAQAASEFSDHMSRLKDAASGLANRFLPPLIDAINSLNRAMGNVPASTGLTVVDFLESQITTTQERIGELRRDLATFGTSDNILSILGFGSREQIREEIDALEAELTRLQTSLAAQRDIAASTAPATPVGAENLAAVLSGGTRGGEADSDERAIARLYESTRTPQEQFMARMDEIGRLYREGKIDLELYNRAALSYVDTLQQQTEAADTAAESTESAYRALMDQLYPNEAAARQWLEDYKLLAEYLDGPELEAALDRLNDRFAGAMEEQRTFADEWVEIWRDAGSQLSLNIGRAVADSILDQERLSDTLRVAARSVAREVIASIVAIGAQRAAMWAAERVGLIATTKVNAAAGAATAAAWAPAAAAVSLATMGANSAPAMAGMTTTFALSETMAAKSLVGQAHDGLDNVPRTGTYLLEAGERVVKREDNRELERFMRESAGPGTININFSVEGRDAPNAAQIVESQRGRIVAMIQREYRNRGRRGGPVQ